MEKNDRQTPDLINVALNDYMRRLSEKKSCNCPLTSERTKKYPIILNRLSYPRKKRQLLRKRSRRRKNKRQAFMLAVLNIALIVYTLSRTSRRVADCVLTSERTREFTMP